LSHFSVKGFKYDGSGPDVFFWVGKGARPNKKGKIIADETGSKDVLLGYKGKDITLKLPSGMSFNDIDWISVWCRRYGINFGHVNIPKNLKLTSNSASRDRNTEE